MSSTPRTDAAAIGFARILVDHDRHTTTELVEANFARHLERELAAARKDAERYRWLRQWSGRTDDFPVLAEPKTGEEMDAAIDKAMEAK